MSTTEETRDVIDRFNEAFNNHDVDGVMALMTDDVVFDNTSPAPDGTRVEGQADVRAFWEKFFAGNPRAWFDTEDMFVTDDRCTTRWRFTFDKDAPEKGHIRGADVFKVRDGKVCEKLSYVKG
jgi:hypothetical protein